MAAASGLEFALSQVDTIASAELLLRAWAIAIGVVLISLLAFIWNYFGTGNKWLALSVPCLWLIGIIGDFVPGPPNTFQGTVSGIHIAQTFAGASFTTLERSLSFLNTFVYLAALGFIWFTVDAAIKLLRRGYRRRALVVGGSILLFPLAGVVLTALVATETVSAPNLLSWCYVIVLVAMSNELGADAASSERLANQLHESEQRMDVASTTVGLGMLSWDIARDSVWADDKARALVGLSATESLTMDQFLNAVDRENRDHVINSIKDALAKGQDHNTEFKVILPDGRSHWIALHGVIDRDETDNPVLMRGLVINVSERRSMGAELHNLHDQLAHADRVSVLGQLASTLAHELSQPLGAILRNSEAAELFLLQDIPDVGELNEILFDIRKDSQRAGDIIQQMRAMLKHREFHPQALSFTELLDNVTLLLSTEASTRRIQLEFDVNVDQGVMFGDPVQLQQVLLNLLLNAMDSVGELPVERRKVMVRAQRRANIELEVAVIDSGPGIAPERLDSVFKPFFTTKPGGLGLGLSITRMIVETHGGLIWAENNAGAGANFRFTLPLAEETAPA